ncbi:MAG: hypothetical protein IKH57_21475 [Clostridia bacterium]|nr:hypothetical protein [Clostridia bacterium]
MNKRDRFNLGSITTISEMVFQLPAHQEDTPATEALTSTVPNQFLMVAPMFSNLSVIVVHAVETHENTPATALVTSIVPNQF